VHDAFRDLRKLADWFASTPQRSSQTSTSSAERIVKRLGATAVPLLGRELRGADPRRREAARDALATLAAHDPAPRGRVIAELHAITDGPAPDETKVVALGLLSELGEHADVRFADPAAIRARAAIALAAQLETAADLAGAADLMVRELEADDIVQMLEVMADAAPRAVHRLAGELAQRLDVASELRERIAPIVATCAPGPEPEPARRPREPLHVAVLVDAAARLVVIASRRITGGRRWRRWAVLIGASGRIDDCLHEDDAGADGGAAPLIANLCASGYRVASAEHDHAHDVVAAAARRTAESTHALPSAYYLGRDLLELGDAHLGDRGPADPSTAILSRAIELVAAGDHARALPLLERCDADNPDAAAALAASLLAQNRPVAALVALDRALAAEPAWPLHHWNLAAALHQLDDTSGCYHALRRFVATSAAASGLLADPDQPARVRRAERMIAELERAARIAGTSLHARASRLEDVSLRDRPLRRRARGHAGAKTRARTRTKRSTP
jgi:tetratricopeptide (TPR) repeat protein